MRFIKFVVISFVFMQIVYGLDTKSVNAPLDIPLASQGNRLEPLSLDIGKPGIFLGINIGYANTDIDWGSSAYPGNTNPVRPTLKSIAPNRFYNYTIGGHIGYKVPLRKNLGIKYYIDYYYFSDKKHRDSMAPIFVINQLRQTDVTITSHSIVANMDLYTEFNVGGDNYFGFSLGVGLGSQSMNVDYKVLTPGVPGVASVNFSNTTDTKYNFTLPVNFALTYRFLGFNVISINTKFSTLPTEYAFYFLNYYGGAVKSHTYNITLGYSFQF